MQAQVSDILRSLTNERIRELGRDAGLAPRGRTKDELVTSIARASRLSFRALVGQLRRDELRSACRFLKLDDQSRARQALMQRLLAAHGSTDSTPPPPLFTGNPVARNVPSEGNTVIARHRQWLVDEVHRPKEKGDATVVRLICLDDDNRGRSLELLWELELGAKVVQPEVTGLGETKRLDEPRHFGAYLNALRWQAVSSADQDFFQSPFRAGIEILDHQLTPLKKALDLPRANLFIADDVGLGKTIEAGLVLQELLLRQRVEMALIVAPASVTLQWQREMDQRFGLHFEIYSRDFMLQRRRERGFRVNPWTTHNRFIISYPLLRRPEYRDPLLAHLASLSGESTRAKKSMLILDEAHTAAPASGAVYAVDSQTTHVIRDIAPRFENRLFLSATPHNGHSGSFSALLEILDPQRFRRGRQVNGRTDLEPVMVRRLKSDLRAVGKAFRFPERHVVRVGIKRQNGVFQASFGDSAGKVAENKPAEHDELDLAKDLAAYTALFEGLGRAKRLPLINLQKRLLSSVAAFHRTLDVHRRTKDDSYDKAAVALDEAQDLASEEATQRADAEATLGLSDEELDAQEDARVVKASAALNAVKPPGAEELLEAMQKKSSRLRHRRCAKTQALMHWIKQNLCPNIDSDADQDKRKKLKWSDKRVIIFTEYGDTLRYLRGILHAAIGDEAEDRVLKLDGGMNEDHRQEVQAAFTSHPSADPVRILLATDAAREGLNLQSHCQHLFHFDIPWNPSRMEQRNGRIDRAMQPKDDVYCHYFVYEDRAEDRVLERLVQKTEVIQRELGSLGDVVAEQITSALAGGIDAESEKQLDLAGEDIAIKERSASDDELPATRDQKALLLEMEQARNTFEKSRAALRFKGEHLKEALDVGLQLAGTAPLTRVADDVADTDSEPYSGPTRYLLPPLEGEEWQATLDPLRPPRGREQDFYDWRKQPPRPVVFDAPTILTQNEVHLHLEHPFVQRVLARFLAQGFSSHDLSRVTAMPVPRNESGKTTALAVGRLCLFGAGAGRLHDTLIVVGADITSAGPVVMDDKKSKDALLLFERLLQRGAKSAGLEAIDPKLQRKLRDDAADLIRLLQKPLREEADAVTVDIKQKLRARGEKEATDLRRLLETQRASIQEDLGAGQLGLAFGETLAEQEQKKQQDRDRQYLENRLAKLEHELENEPGEVRDLYDVKLERFELVGLVYLYPELAL